MHSSAPVSIARRMPFRLPSFARANSSRRFRMITLL